MDSAGENFQNNSLCVFLNLAPPCGLGEESRESGFLAEDVVSTWARVWGDMGCQALGVLWSSLPRHCDYLHILKKKIRPNFSKEWLFFLQPRFSHSFRFWPGSFSLMVVNHMARLSQWGRRICNGELGLHVEALEIGVGRLACEFWWRQV